MPTYYRIQIKERLDPHWAEWFDGMTLTHAADGGTLLEGTLLDQAALYGLISKARDLGLTLIAVNVIAAEPPAQQGNPISAAASERGEAGADLPG